MDLVVVFQFYTFPQDIIANENETDHVLDSRIQHDNEKFENPVSR